MDDRPRHRRVAVGIVGLVRRMSKGPSSPNRALGLKLVEGAFARWYISNIPHRTAPSRTTPAHDLQVDILRCPANNVGNARDPGVHHDTRTLDHHSSDNAGSVTPPVTVLTARAWMLTAFPISAHELASNRPLRVLDRVLLAASRCERRVPSNQARSPSTGRRHPAPSFFRAQDKEEGIAWAMFSAALRCKSSSGILRDARSTRPTGDGYRRGRIT